VRAGGSGAGRGGRGWVRASQAPARVTVAVDQTVSRVESVQRGPLPFHQQGDRVTVELPIGDVDVLQLFYRAPAAGKGKT